MDVNLFYEKLDELYAHHDTAAIEKYMTQSLDQARAENDTGAITAVGNELAGFYRVSGKIDQAIDHFLYTYGGKHGPGPYVPRIVEEYEEMVGHPVEEDFGEWEPCHDILMANNVMGIENLGGDLDKVKNQRFLFCAFPLRWYMGDGTIVRAVAFVPSDRIDRSVPDKEYPYGVY